MNEPLIIRHGECEANIDHRITGVKESALTQKGIKQAQQLGGKLAGSDLIGIVSSTIGRAAKTAEIVGAYIDRPVVTIPHFRAQSFGVLEGYTLDEARIHGLEQYLHNKDSDKFTHFVPGGETAMEVQLRVFPTFNTLPVKTVLVTHNSVVRSIAGGIWKLSPKDWTSMTVPNCDILRLGTKGFDKFESEDQQSQKPDDLLDLYEQFKDEGLYRTRSRIARLLAIQYPGWECVAAQMIADGYFADAITATTEIENNKKDVLTDLLTHYDTVGVIHYGSSAHSPFYAVKKDSDLDFDLVIKDQLSRSLAELPLFATVRDRFAQTLKNARNAGVDICSFKFDYKGYPVSMRITKEAVLKDICDNNPSSQVPRIIREFRDNPKPSGSYYAGRYSFDGEEHSWFPRIHQVEGGVVSLNPISRIDKRGRYVNGVTTDKYLSQPQLAGNVDLLSRYLFDATTAVVKRLIQEEQEGITTNGSLVNLMARHDTMPKHTKQSMAFKEQIIRKMIEGRIV